MNIEEKIQAKIQEFVKSNPENYFLGDRFTQEWVLDRGASNDFKAQFLEDVEIRVKNTSNTKEFKFSDSIGFVDLGSLEEVDIQTKCHYRMFIEPVGNRYHCEVVTDPTGKKILLLEFVSGKPYYWSETTVESRSPNPIEEKIQAKIQEFVKSNPENYFLGDHLFASKEEKESREESLKQKWVCARMSSAELSEDILEDVIQRVQDANNAEDFEFTDLIKWYIDLATLKEVDITKCHYYLLEEPAGDNYRCEVVTDPSDTKILLLEFVGD